MKGTVSSIPHCYVDRRTGRICQEQLIGDRHVRLLYSTIRENAPVLFRTLTTPRASRWMSYLSYGLPLGNWISGCRKFVESASIDLSECLEPSSIRTYRELFERKIRYWECRPLPAGSAAVVSPADSRVLLGSFAETSCLFLKEKFFGFRELLGSDKRRWQNALAGGDYAIFRLTPDKYHYNHTPVSGIVKDIYRIDGANHSCNPSALMELATPLSKNERIVTILDTDVKGGSRAGIVAMVEITAMMIGKVVQCYSSKKYDSPRPVEPGMFLDIGCPKSLYRPGSSTDVLIFQKNRVAFDPDLLLNMKLATCPSRFSAGLGRPLVETDVRVRSQIGQVLRRV